MRASLALAMIARNEAEMLGDCLKSVRGLVSEVVVVDTGSSDGTVAIAEQCGARVCHQPWTDNFSEARNVALAACSSEWILVLDADECLDTKDHGTLRALMAGATAWRFETRNYTQNMGLSTCVPSACDDPMGRGLPGWYPSKKVRLFPNGRGIRFSGRIHELVNPSLEVAGISIQECDVPIHHYGCLKGEAHIVAKQAYYLELGRAKAREHPDDPRVHGELGNQLAEMGRSGEALAAYKEALRREPDNVEYLKGLGAMLHLVGNHGHAQRVFEMILARGLDEGEVWRNLGVVHAAQAQWEEALRAFEQAIEMGPSHPDALRYRSIALEQLGVLEAAAEASRHCLVTFPGHLDAARLFALQMDGLGRGTEVEAFLRETLRHADSDAEIFYSLGVMYEARGQVEEAREAFAQCVALAPDHAGANEGLTRLC